MATLNISTKVGAAVSAAATLSPGQNNVLFTCPAGAYAILNYFYSAGNSQNQLLVGGQIVEFTSGTSERKGTIYVGPGQTVQAVCQNTGGNSLNVYISGVRIDNTL